MVETLFPFLHISLLKGIHYICIDIDMKHQLHAWPKPTQAKNLLIRLNIVELSQLLLFEVLFGNFDFGFSLRFSLGFSTPLH